MPGGGVRRLPGKTLSQGGIAGNHAAGAGRIGVAFNANEPSTLRSDIEELTEEIRLARDALQRYLPA
jgi:hypothetical protein